MTESPPTWTAFDAHEPPDLPEGDGRVVVVAALEGAESWAPALAVDLARAWGGSGRRVVLFDGGISSPSLHTLLGRDNDEGLTDAVAYGASVGRVARRVDGEPLFFVPAGTAVADPRGILEHPRWTGMCRGFLEAGATLVMFLPSQEPGAEPALVDATDLVILAPEGARLPERVAAYGGKVRAVLGPVGALPTEPAAPAGPVAPVGAAGTAAASDRPEEPGPEVGDVTETGSEPDAAGEASEASADAAAGTVADGLDDLLVESPTEFEFHDDADPAFSLTPHDADDVDEADVVDAHDARSGEAPTVSEPQESPPAADDGADFWDEPWADDDHDRGSDESAWDLEPDLDADVHALDAVTDAGTTDPGASLAEGASDAHEDVAGGDAGAGGSSDEDAPAGPATRHDDPATASDRAESGTEPMDEAVLAFGGPESGAPNVDVGLDDGPEPDDGRLDSGASGVPGGAGALAPERPPVPTADEILAEAGEPVGAGVDARPTPERVASALKRRESGGGGRTALLTVVVVVLVLVAAVAWWLGLLEIPGLGSAAGAGSLDAGALTLAAAEAPAAPTPPPAPTPIPAGGAFSVALEAHRDPGVATARAEGFRDRAPDHLWVTVPVAVDGVQFHRVLVGPAADPLEAADLAHAVGLATGRDASSWLVRATPRAFLLHEDRDRAAAVRRAEQLTADGIPAYVLSVEYTDGSRRWRVYAGAYADADEAAALRGLLEERGLPAVLSERIGRLP